MATMPIAGPDPDDATTGTKALFKMRTYTPRLPPLRDDELDAEQQETIERFRANGPVFAIARTFLRHPRMLRAYNALGMHTFSADNSLEKRESEIVTMRTVWRARAGYQWSRHVPMAARAGLSTAEIMALKRPIEQGDWSERDAALIAAVDALMDDHFIPEDVWAKLASYFDVQQCIDAVMLCGRYAMAAMFLNTAGTQLDPDVELDPELDLRE